MSRIFFIATRLPVPPEGGADFRTWSLIQAAMLGGHVVGAFGIGRRSRLVRPEGPVIWRSASLEAALAHNATAEQHAAPWMADPDWSPADWYHTDEIESELTRALEEFQPDVVVLEQLGVASYLDVARRSGACVVLDAHNIEADLQAQIAQAEGHPVRKVVRRAFAERTESIERLTVGEVDVVWTCSDRDAAGMASRYGRSHRLHVVPNTIDVSRYDAIYGADRDPAAPIRVIFPAQFGYAPNRRAAEWLIDQVIPGAEREGVDLAIDLPGRDPSRRMVDAAAAGLAEVPGFVEDMLSHLAVADVMVIPLHEGSGTRLKALEAFAAGLPVVSTAKGVEGLGAGPGDHYLRAETAADFVAGIRAAVERPVRDHLRHEARELVDRHFSVRSLVSVLHGALPG